MANVKATAQDQTVVGTSGSDQLTGYATGAILVGGGGDDIYYLLSADDVVVENANSGNDSILTWGTNYILPDNVENLSIFGANFFGIGNALSNGLTGGDGSQLLYGAGGNDTLTGGAGSDTFVVQPGSGSDTITDFAAGDIARVGAYGFRSFEEVSARLTQDGSNVVLRLSASETLTFLNTSVSSLSSGNFQYALDTGALTQTFNDDFNTLNLQSQGGVWNTSLYTVNGSQAYVDDNYALGTDPFTIENGILTIHAARSTAAAKADTGKDYTSGLLTTRDAFSQTYGYFEIRCEIPGDAGTWPAFWLLSADGQWPPELDVFEQVGDNGSLVYLTSHTGVSGTPTATGVSSYVSDVTGMHTYGLLWTAENLVWYIDGVEVYRMPTPADMHKPMYMVTNLAVGGSWPGEPDASFTSADYKIDYARAYQLNSELGTDNIVTSGIASITLDAVSRGLVLTGTLNLNGTGNALDNNLVGNSSDNVLNGLAGADTMTGGAGNDTYYVDNVGDAVIEADNGGTDTIIASVSYALPAYVENLTLAGTSNISGTGNSLDNIILGNAGNNYIDGGVGSDTMIGGAGNDTYYVYSSGDMVVENAGEGTDTVIASISYALTTNVENLTQSGTGNISGTGNALANTITGNAGSNVLDGGSGADTLIGGAGNDTYYVENAGDVVVENAGEGIDTILASISYTLSANVENLTLGSTGINATGNGLSNVITGNAGNNVLDGKGGADTMTGGAGNDTYYVENIGDVVVENAGDGIDTVIVSVSYKLSANVENLILSGTGNISGTGNTLDNTITGNAGNNYLDGGSGADTMSGGYGNDTYYVYETGDVVVENAGEGTDTIIATTSYTLSANVENLTLSGTAYRGTGNGLDNTITGNASNNALDGGAGADVLIGGRGVDALTGGSGNDRFVFQTANDSPAGYFDTITDFAKSDLIDISGLSSQTLTYLHTGAFTGHAGEVQIAAYQGGVMVNIDLTGDRVADSQIFLANTALSTFSASGSDFVL